MSDVVHDYLEGIYRHLIKVLAGEGLSQDKLDYHVLFTVPALFLAAPWRILSALLWAQGGWSSRRGATHRTRGSSAVHVHDATGYGKRDSASGSQSHNVIARILTIENWSSDVLLSVMRAGGQLI